MVIFLAFLQSQKKHPIPAYSFWEYYIKNGIEEAGHSWIESADADWAEALVYNGNATELEKWKEQTWQKVVDEFKGFSKKPDLFLSYFYPNHIDESAINLIKLMGIPCVNFFCDNVREFTKIPDCFQVFNLNWVPEYKALDMYKKAGFPHVHLPMPMWIKPELRTISESENGRVSFIGSIDIQRLRLFESVNVDLLDIDIYGAGWKEKTNKDSIENISKGKKVVTIFDKVQNQIDFISRYGFDGYLRKLEQRKLVLKPSIKLSKHLKGLINFEDYIEITKESMITLGINRYPSYRYPLEKPDTYSRLRDIEAPMLGCCYLTEWTEGLDKMYEIGKEIQVYRNAEELNDKICYLKENNNKRKIMRKASQKKALQQHSIQNTIKMIQNYL